MNELSGEVVMKNLGLKFLEQTLQLGHGWEITSAGGATGEAYVAQLNEEKLFLKRNSSPFLAVLSAEGIVPKLIWTKRMENGDVITAQRWLEGRELKPIDMESDSVAKLLSKIHHSEALLDMLRRINTTPLLPLEILIEIECNIDSEMHQNINVQRALSYLQSEALLIETNQQVVCHCDVNHNNWLLSDNDELFLIDWDGARIADPALDLGLLLYWYIPPESWDKWLSDYGITLTDSLAGRMKWYVTAQTLLSIIWHKRRDESQEVHQWLVYLKKLLDNKRHFLGN